MWTWVVAVPSPSDPHGCPRTCQAVPGHRARSDGAQCGVRADLQAALWSGLTGSCRRFGRALFAAARFSFFKFQSGLFQKGCFGGKCALPLNELIRGWRALLFLDVVMGVKEPGLICAPGLGTPAASGSGGYQPARFPRVPFPGLPAGRPEAGLRLWGGPLAAPSLTPLRKIKCEVGQVCSFASWNLRCNRCLDFEAKISAKPDDGFPPQCRSAGPVQCARVPPSASVSVLWGRAAWECVLGLRTLGCAAPGGDCGGRCVQQEKGWGQGAGACPGAVPLRGSRRDLRPHPQTVGLAAPGAASSGVSTRGLCGGLCWALGGPEPRFLIGRPARAGCGQAVRRAEALLPVLWTGGSVAT